MRLDYKLTPLSTMIGDTETVLWHAKPYKLCFILESIFNPLLPFALVWALFDGAFIFAMFSGGVSAQEPMLGFAIPFFALHLMPVWIYLGGILLSFIGYKNTEYFITDKAVYVSSGTIGITCKRKEYKDIKEINVERGFVDQILGVGDVVIKDEQALREASYYSSRSRSLSNQFKMSICDVHEYNEVYRMLREQKEQADQLNNLPSA